MLERVVLSGPLSGKSAFRLLVEGEWTLEECQRVVDFLVVMRDHYKKDAYTPVGPSHEEGFHSAGLSSTGDPHN